VSTYAYATEAAALAALVHVTRAELPGYTPRLARQRARDFLAALAASGAPGAVYPVGRTSVYVERVTAT
jgi:hypothetical protein